MIREREREREFVTAVIELLIYGEKLTVYEHIIFMTGILNKEALTQSPKCNFEADLIQATWETAQ